MGVGDGGWQIVQKARPPLCEIIRTWCFRHGRLLNNYHRPDFGSVFYIHNLIYSSGQLQEAAGTILILQVRTVVCIREVKELVRSRVIFLIFKKLILERGEGREKDKKEHQFVASRMGPDRGLNTQPRHVP